MKLPGGQTAIVEDRKLLNYLLNPAHPVGRGKAHLFKVLLDIDLDNWQTLRDALLKAAATEDAIDTENSTYGQKYELRFSMAGPRGAYTILSVWMTRVLGW